MLHSILLHLEGARQARPVIQLGVALARAGRSRVRGLTLVDTRESEASRTTEAAAFVVSALRHQASVEFDQGAVQLDLSQACLAARLDFDVRRSAGDPLSVLPKEARFHDLVISSGASESVVSSADLVTLVDRGVQPLVLVGGDQTRLARVLLVYDGSEAAGRAIRSFFGLGLLAETQQRLLAIGPNLLAARESLREMANYCRALRPSIETGYLAGSPRQVLLSYAQKWDADLVVLGLTSGSRLLRRWLAGRALTALQQQHCGLYITS